MRQEKQKKEKIRREEERRERERKAEEEKQNKLREAEEKKSMNAAQAKEYTRTSYKRKGFIAFLRERESNKRTKT
jgi:hypothetical protein